MNSKECRSLADRVREQINSKFDWNPQARVKAFVRSKTTKSQLIDSLPQHMAPAPVGVVRRLAPTRHEQAILRRAAQPGAAILITMRQNGPVFVFEDGTLIIGKHHDKPMTAREFERLRQFLVADRDDSLFPNGLPQRFTVRQLPQE